MITNSRGTFFTMSLLFQWKGLLFSPQPRNKNTTASAGVEHIVYNSSGAIWLNLIWNFPFILLKQAMCSARLKGLLLGFSDLLFWSFFRIWLQLQFCRLSCQMWGWYSNGRRLTFRCVTKLVMWNVHGIPTFTISEYISLYNWKIRIIYTSSAGFGISQAEQKVTIKSIFKDSGILTTNLWATLFMEEFWKVSTRSQILKLRSQFWTYFLHVAA
jgi:hypothetical protein